MSSTKRCEFSNLNNKKSPKSIIRLGGSMLKNLFKRNITAAEFWSWFEKNREAYFELDENSYEILFNKLGVQLSKYHKEVTFEFGVELKEGKREFIISADGMLPAFPAVQQLVEAAPSLDQFEIVAFRQRESSEQEVCFEDVILETKDVFFTSEHNSELNCLDIVMYIKGYREEDDNFIGAAFIMLDSLIGEFDVGTKLGDIQFEAYEGQNDVRPILELVTLVDDM